jgi:hypothetical protein
VRPTAASRRFEWASMIDLQIGNRWPSTGDLLRVTSLGQNETRDLGRVHHAGLVRLVDFRRDRLMNPLPASNEKNLPNDLKRDLREIIYSRSHEKSLKVARFGLLGDFFMELAQPFIGRRCELEALRNLHRQPGCHIAVVYAIRTQS